MTENHHFNHTDRPISPHGAMFHLDLTSFPLRYDRLYLKVEGDDTYISRHPGRCPVFPTTSLDQLSYQVPSTDLQTKYYFTLLKPNDYNTRCSRNYSQS
jgi:hypothetical protein